LEAGDPLSELDRILASWARKDREAAELAAKRAARERDLKQEYLDRFIDACRKEVEPAMQAVRGRLKLNGGEGIIEERLDGDGTVHSPRLTLWMSLEGDIVGKPRRDTCPHLRIAADVTRREVHVSARDADDSSGGNGVRKYIWQLSDLTHDRITHELVSIVWRTVTMAVPRVAAV
jgi:hypothetical protein